MLKHRSLPEGEVTAEVKLTYQPQTITESYPKKAAETSLSLVRNVSVSPDDIVKHLVDAKNEERYVFITGRKPDGTPYERQPVMPVNLSSNERIVEVYTSSGYRFFLLRGIERVEDS